MSERYKRQLMLPEVGEAGQKKLGQAKVLIIGVGGLGSPLALYLAAAGVGTIGLVDGDKVELNNLHRQIIHSTKTIGQKKVDSAKGRLNDLNPEVNVYIYSERLTKENAHGIVDGYDLVADCTDNYPSRYLINDVCIKMKKTLVHGAILKFGGQLTTIVPGETPSYRDLFPEPEKLADLPPPSGVGLLGVVPGVIGLLMANEIIKLILGIGENLKGKLLVYDAISATLRPVQLNLD